MSTKWVSVMRPALVLDDEDVEACEECEGEGSVADATGETVRCLDCLGFGYVHGWDSLGRVLPAKKGGENET
jgi:hypothetical protein